ncbi:MAG: anti-sigma factor [Calditrichia bacterium]
MLRKLWFLVIATVLIVAGCEKDDNGPNPTGSNKIAITLQNAPMLQNGFHYEGWAIIDGNPVSTGKFNVNSNGDITDLNNNVIMGGEFSTNTDISDASAVVLTIEPDGDNDTTPAETHVLAGDVQNKAATLTAGNSKALGNDFSGAMGDYILATPTNGGGTNENSGIWFLHPPTTMFTFSFTGLTPLMNGYHYEGWAIVDGSPVTTGKFNLNSSGDLVDLDGNMIDNGEFTVVGDLSGATDIVLTIEPPNDNDPAPAATHYLGGTVSNNTADLSTASLHAFGTDFSSASGKYILATPTNGPNTDENSGIWFLDLSTGSTAQALMLPALPAGWQYEGWTVINGTPVTSGRFMSGDMADFDDPYSSTQSPPHFPGEDYLVNAPAGLTFPTDIAGGTAVVSIEPEPDDDPAPFALKPLVGMIPSDAVDHVTYDMNNNISNFPGGTVSMTVMAPMAALQLASLPSGWKYEGWAVINGTPVTSGKFTAADMADESAPYSSTMPAPPFPGEDYLTNAPAGLTFPTDLSGGMAVISIEPDPDDDPAPFAFKPLVGMIPSNAMDHTVYNMNSNITSFFSGTATIK